MCKGSIVPGLVAQVLTKAQLDHPVYAVGVGLGVIKGEPGGQQRRLKQEDHQVLHRLVVLVHLRLLPQGLQDGVRGVDLQVLLSRHVAHGGAVSESLSLHDPLHVGGPAIRAGDDAARGGDQAVGDGDLGQDKDSGS